MDSVINFKREVYTLALNELVRFLPAVKSASGRRDSCRQPVGIAQAASR
jgi:hypothetical protein